MGFSVTGSTDDKENNVKIVDTISYTYDNYTKLVNVEDGSEDIYFKSVLIYSSEHVEDSIIKTYYSPKGVYCDITSTISNNREVTFTDINNVDSENAKLLKFYHYSKVYSDKPNIINFLKLAKAQNKYRNITDSVTIMINDKLELDLEDDRVKEFYKLENISKTLSFSIPYLIAKDQIENCVEEITSYLASGSIDMNVINSSIETLKNCEFCFSSIEILKSVSSSKNVDFHKVLDKLNENINNLETIIKINTKDYDFIK